MLSRAANVLARRAAAAATASTVSRSYHHVRVASSCINYLNTSTLPCNDSFVGQRRTYIRATLPSCMPIKTVEVGISSFFLFSLVERFLFQFLYCRLPWEV
mmetsp:Transcript_28926/g.38428  ORF Transcript_28926/g.38428 Transcript_28926/m.38428 type:complete len:101 (+) Transcript_28926:33-335(+)